jgi:hypothetical protein
MEETKKRPNIMAIAMVFLALSAIFIVMAYGYGEVKQMNYDNEFYHNTTNFEKLAKELGYGVFKNTIEPQIEPVMIFNISEVT